MKVCFAGTGRVGRALANVVSARGDEVVVWGADTDTADWIAAGLAARSTVFPQDEVGDAGMLVIDGDLDLLGRTCRAYGPTLAVDAVVVETAQPKNEAVRAVAASGLSRETISITAVSDTRWLVDAPTGFDEVLRHTGVECLRVPSRHHDLWRAVTDLSPGLVAAALAEARTDLDTICPHLDADGTRLDTMTRTIPTAGAIATDRQAVMMALPRVISVLQDTLRWLEFQETARLEELLRP